MSITTRGDLISACARPLFAARVRGGARVAARAPANNPLGGASFMSQRAVEPFVAVVRFGAWWH